MITDPNRTNIIDHSQKESAKKCTTSLATLPRIKMKKSKLMNNKSPDRDCGNKNDHNERGGPEK